MRMKSSDSSDRVLTATSAMSYSPVRPILCCAPPHVWYSQSQPITHLFRGKLFFVGQPIFWIYLEIKCNVSNQGKIWRWDANIRVFVVLKGCLWKWVNFYCEIDEKKHGVDFFPIIFKRTNTFLRNARNFWGLKSTKLGALDMTHHYLWNTFQCDLA